MPQFTQGYQRLPLLLFIAWRNLWRNPVRSLLTVSALGGGLTMMILYAALVEGMIRQMQDFATQLTVGHIQIHRRTYVNDQDLYGTLPWKQLANIEAALPRVRVAPRLYAAGLAASGDRSTGVLLKAIDPEKEARVTSMHEHIRTGSYILSLRQKTDRGLLIYGVVVGAQLSRNLGVNPGDELVVITQAADGSIGNALFEVTGIMKPIDPAFDRTGIMMSIPAYQELMYLERGVHEFAIGLERDEEMIPVQEKIKSILNDDSILVQNWRELIPAVADMLDISMTLILIIGGIMVGLASLGMLNTMLMAIHECTHEFGILLSIGMSKYWLLLMVMLESLFLSLVSAVFGSVLGVGFGRLLEKHGIDYSASLPDGLDYGGIIFEPVMKGHLTTQNIIYSIVLMLIVAMVASFIPSWRTVRMTPAEATR